MTIDNPAPPSSAAPPSTVRRRIITGATASRQIQAFSVQEQLRAVGKDFLVQERVGNSPVVLREQQLRIMQSVGEYFTDVADRGEQDIAAAFRPMGRIIQPPRTGKTVVAGHIMAEIHRLQHARLSRARFTFLVPRRVLVDQAFKELERQLPDQVVYAYRSQSEPPGEGVDVVVTTYNMLHEDLKAGRVPRIFKESLVVFADEAHHTATELRQSALTHGFDPFAVRIALTATPDFSDLRRLASFFPDLIHEISLGEAMERGLIAPFSFYLYEATAIDGKAIPLQGDDYAPEALGRALTQEAIFETVRQLRFDPLLNDKPALVCCVNKAQAEACLENLSKHWPEGRPKPRLILAGTSREDRESWLLDFEEGRLDTIINVGVLIEGWSCPTCKALIDIAPSASRLRATQKFFRPLTKDGDREAVIAMVMPQGLATMPLTPHDIIGASLNVADMDEPEMLPFAGTKPAKPPRRRPKIEVKDIVARKTTLLQGRVELPKLDPKDTRGIQKVLASCPEFQDALRPPPVTRFKRLFFQHPLFTGRGDRLLWHLGIPVLAGDYERFLYRHDPRRMMRYWFWSNAKSLATDDGPEEDPEVLEARDPDVCLDDVAVRMLQSPGLGPQPPEVYLDALRALGDPGPIRTPEEILLARETLACLLVAIGPPPEDPDLVASLHPWKARPWRWMTAADRLSGVLRASLLMARLGIGMDTEEKLTFKAVGDRLGLSRSRISVALQETDARLHWSLRFLDRLTLPLARGVFHYRIGCPRRAKACDALSKTKPFFLSSW